MIKTFFVPWIWIGAGNTQTLSMDHFATKAVGKHLGKIMKVADGIRNGKEID